MGLTNGIRIRTIYDLIGDDLALNGIYFQHWQLFYILIYDCVSHDICITFNIKLLGVVYESAIVTRGN